MSSSSFSFSASASPSASFSFSFSLSLSSSETGDVGTCPISLKQKQRRDTVHATALASCFLVFYAFIFVKLVAWTFVHIHCRASIWDTRRCAGLRLCAYANDLEALDLKLFR